MLRCGGNGLLASVVMASSLEQIVADIDALSLVDQLWLIERLVQQVRLRALKTSGSIGSTDEALKRMAADPAIQQELRQIDTEFRVTELDGLAG